MTLRLSTNALNINAILKAQLQDLRSADKVLRAATVSALADTSNRIFERGFNSENNAIGSYSPAYLKERIKKGRGASAKIVLSFTGQMEQDYTFGTHGSGYALGFLNAFNAQKAAWNEARFGTIFHLTDSELTRFVANVETQVSQIFS